MQEHNVDRIAPACDEMLDHTAALAFWLVVVAAFDVVVVLFVVAAEVVLLDAELEVLVVDEVVDGAARLGIDLLAAAETVTVLGGYF